MNSEEWRWREKFYLLSFASGRRKMERISRACTSRVDTPILIHSHINQANRW